MTIGEIVFGLIAVGSLIVSVLTARSTASKNLVDSTGDWYDRLERQLKEHRREIDELRHELVIQRRRRHEAEERSEVLEHRVRKLEAWIVDNTGVQPGDINGHPV